MKTPYKLTVVAVASAKVGYAPESDRLRQGEGHMEGDRHVPTC